MASRALLRLRGRHHDRPLAAAAHTAAARAAAAHAAAALSAALVADVTAAPCHDRPVAPASSLALFTRPVTSASTPATAASAVALNSCAASTQLATGCSDWEFPKSTTATATTAATA